MIRMATEDAFAAYEAVRHRLPPAGPPGTATPIASIEEVADRFDAFLLDAFGVLNIGETAVPGVAERIERLRARGKRVLVLTNAAGYPHELLLARYDRLGYRFDPADVVSSRAALRAGVAGRVLGRCGLMVTAATGIGDLAGFEGLRLAEDPAIYDRVDSFVLLGSAEWTEARQALLEDTLRDRPRPVLVGNPDIVAPRETGFSIEPGHFAHRLADRTGLRPEFFGKPFRNVFDLAFRRLGPGIDRGRVLMVGDSLHTDILGAQARRHGHRGQGCRRNPALRTQHRLQAFQALPHRTGGEVQGPVGRGQKRENRQASGQGHG